MLKKLLIKIGVLSEEKTEINAVFVGDTYKKMTEDIAKQIKMEIEEKAVVVSNLPAPVESIPKVEVLPEPPKPVVLPQVEVLPEPPKPIILPPVVEFKRVYKSFGEKTVLNDINFCVDDIPNKGELISIVGQSGCGKSTLLRMIAGLEPHFPPTSGEAMVFNKSLGEAGPDRGVVDQSYSLFPHLTTLKNVAYGLKLRGVNRKERHALAREWIEKVGLHDSENKYPYQLSGGMKQRVAIASTLILKPKIILMDEPFGALDPKIRRSAWKLLIDLWKEQESTVFLVTHSMEEAFYLGDRIFRMGTNPGRLVEIVKAPRPDAPAEEMRKETWFNLCVQELQRRLETDSPACGELPYPKA